MSYRPRIGCAMATSKMMQTELLKMAAFMGGAMKLLEATMRRVDRIAILRPIEVELEKAMEEAFFRQGEAFIRRLKAFKPWFPPEELKEQLIPTGLSVAEIMSLWEEIALGTWYFFEQPMNTAAVKAMMAGKAAAIANVSWMGSFTLGFDEMLLNQIPALTKMQVHSINRTTQKYINTQIRHAMEEGWSYNRTAKAIIGRFKEFAIGKPQLHIQSRAHLVAITETGNLYVEGTMRTARELEAMGLVQEKFWLTVGDDRVSDGCRANTAVKWIPLNQPFPSKDMQPLRFPGCRCDLLTRRKK